MELKQKYIRKTISLLLGLMIFAHALVPHHHHYHTLIASPDFSECNTTTQSNHHNGNHAVHCHDINLVIEKTSNTISKSFQKDQKIINYLSAGLKPIVATNTDIFISIEHLVSLYQKQIQLPNHSLRAPPAFV